MELHWYEYSAGKWGSTGVRTQVTCVECLRLLLSVGIGPSVRVTCSRTRGSDLAS